MDNNVKILLIVEGESLVRDFFSQIQKIYNLSFEFVCVKNNIYALYKKMKALDFQADIKQVLTEIIKDENVKEKLKEKFAYTYLIFDLDAHHTEKNEVEISLEKIVEDNFKRVQEMTEYFVDETDPTIGKIYINYPMMESFKDCNSFGDEEFLNSKVLLENLKKYKEFVGKKKMANKRLDRYDIDDFNKISKLNVMKLQSIIKGKNEVINYFDYQNISVQSNISVIENKIFFHKKEIAILNTASFFILDYFGNKNGFFDNIMNNEIE